MSAPVESLFEDYCSALVAAFGHADRHGLAKLYLKGLRGSTAGASARGRTARSQ
jgi:hypothetical protein